MLNLLQHFKKSGMMRSTSFLTLVLTSSVFRLAKRCIHCEIVLCKNCRETYEKQ